MPIPGFDPVIVGLRLKWVLISAMMWNYQYPVASFDCQFFSSGVLSSGIAGVANYDRFSGAR